MGSRQQRVSDPSIEVLKQKENLLGLSINQKQEQASLLEKEIVDLQNTIASLKEEAGSFESKKIFERDSYNAVLTLIKDANERLGIIQKSLSESEKAVLESREKAEAIIKSAEEEIENKKQDIFTQQEFAKKAIAEYQEQLTRLKLDIAHSLSSKISHENEAARVELKKTELSKEVESLQEKCVKLTEELSTKRQQILNSDQIIQSSSDKISVLSSDIFELTKEKQAHEAGLLALEEMRLKKEEEIKKLDGEKFELAEYRQQLERKERFIREKYAQAKVSYE